MTQLQESVFLPKEYKKEIIQYILDNIDYQEGIHADDLHHALFNTDYYIIGTYKAKQWCGDNVFDIIETIREYEEFNFAEVSTDLSDSESVVNMYTYIIGEEILSLIEYYLLYDSNDELTMDIIEKVKDNLMEVK
jgi:chloramphenicol O-acetyltransferase